MKLDEIKDEIMNALQVDEKHLDRSAIETPVRYGKLLVIRTNESMELKRLEIEYADLEQEKRIYYSGKADPEVYKEKPLDVRVLKSEMNKYLEADKDLQKLALNIGLQGEKIALINDALKGVLQKTFHIKAAIDYQKMQNGVL
jgi:hypothetical protein